MNDPSPVAATSVPPSLWPAFGLGLGVAAGNGLARFSYALLLPAMREDLNWSYADAGWLNTANALGYVFGAVSGYLLLRGVRPSRLFNAGLLLTFVALALTGLWANVAWLTVTRLVSGIGAAWVFACGGALVAARYQESPNLRGTATGLFFGGAGIGIAAAGLLISPILAHFGNGAWPAAWLLLGVLAALASVWPYREAGRIGGAANAVSDTALNLRGLMPCLWAYFFFASGYIVYMTFIFAWIGGQGMSWQFGMLVWTVLGGGVALSPFAWRRALNRRNPATTLAASCTMALVGTIIPVFWATALGIGVSAALFGLSMFIAPSAVAVLVRGAMPVHQLAKGITLFTVVFSMGQSIGPIVAGWIADAATLNDSLIFGAVLLGLAACMALAGRLGAAVRAS